MPKRYVVLLGSDNTQPLHQRQNRREEVVGFLKDTHGQHNEQARNQLSSWRGIEVVNDFWVNDSLVIEVEDPKDIERLKRMPWVRAIETEITTYEVLGHPVEPSSDVLASESDLTWGIINIQAEKVWNEFGITGEGIRVGVCDTGVRASHDALAGRIVTVDSTNSHYPGGWIDFNMDGSPRWQAPRDGHGHGTHVSGTIAGDRVFTSSTGPGTKIGVAPNSQLVCAGLFNSSGGTTDARVMASLQWALDPYYQSSTTNTAPRVVNNSWGAENNFRTTYIAIVQAYEAAGILVTAASGNGGPGTSGSIGHDYGVFGVGAIANDNGVTSFSSGRIVGRHQFTDSVPSHWPHGWIAPDISAPGASVLSCVSDSNTAYAWYNGTSMANPHLCGAAALMFEADPTLTPQQVRTIMRQTADWDDRHRTEPAWDTRTGAGRLNAYEAVKAVL